MIGLTLSKWYKDIADAIRSKGISDTFKPSEMAAAIRNIGGGEMVMNYNAAMGYVGSGTVIENKIANLIAYAAENNKDVIIKFKIGSAAYDDWILSFYFGDYLRIGPNSTTGTLYMKVGGGQSHTVTCDPTKEYKIVIHTDTKKIDTIQDGSVIESADYWSTDNRPFDTLSGSTAIYAAQNWLEYLTIELV